MIFTGKSHSSRRVRGTPIGPRDGVCLVAYLTGATCFVTMYPYYALAIKGPDPKDNRMRFSLIDLAPTLSLNGLLGQEISITIKI